MLREGGIFFCALPEPRVTFDREREPTTVEHLTHDHAAGRASRRDHFVDWVENVERHQPWWQTERPDPAERVQFLLDMDYSIHFHVWRPDTFLDYLAAVRRENGVVFEVLDFAGCQPGVDDEFIFILRKGIAPVPATAPALANPWFNPALGCRRGRRSPRTRWARARLCATRRARRRGGHAVGHRCGTASPRAAARRTLSRRDATAVLRAAPRVSRGARVPAAPAVSIIVLVMRSIANVQRCLDSFAAGGTGAPDAEVIVLGQRHAAAGARRARRARRPRGVAVDREPRVRWWLQLGVALCPRRPAACSSTTTPTVTPGWLTALGAAMDADERTGVVGSRILLR